MREGVADIASGIGLETELEQIFYYAPVAFDAACVKSVRAAAERFGYPHRDMVSGAGHDACYLSQVAPTSMVFVPCVDGISHNEIEDATHRMDRGRRQRVAARHAGACVRAGFMTLS